MSKNNQNSENITQALPDPLAETIIVPAGKLDADQYSADDLDGVTESLFGSGNMAYASLQASQTDEMLFQEESIQNTSDIFPAINAADIRSSGRQGVSESNPNATGSSDNGNFASSTVGSVGASTLSSDIGSFTPSLNIANRGDFDGAAYANDTSVRKSNASTNSDSNVTNNGDVTNEGDTTINNYNEAIGDLGLDLDLGVLDSVGAGLGIAIEDSIVGQLSFGTALSNLDSIVHDLTGLNLPFVTDLGATLGFDLLGNDDINDGNDVNIAGLDLPDIDLDIVEDIIGDIDLDINLPTELADIGTLLDGVTETLGGLGNLNIANLGDTLDVLGNQGALGSLDILAGNAHLTESFDVIVDDLLNGDLTGSLLGDNVTDLVDGLTGGVLGDLGLGGDDTDESELISDTVDGPLADVGNVVDDVTGGVTEDVTEVVDTTVDAVTDIADALTGDLTDGILGSNNDNEDSADTDLAADLGIDALDNEIIDEIVDVALDPVEDLVGDVDLGLGLDTDLLGGDGSETDNAAGDTDITVETDIEIVDNIIAEIAEDIPLDPVEAIVGDIDLDVGAAANILGDTADPLIDNGSGGTGEDTVLADIGDVLGDVAESLLDGGEDGGDGDVTDLVDGLTGGVLGGLGEDGSDGESSDDTGNSGIISPVVDPVVDDVTDVVDGLTGGATEDVTDTVDEIVDAVTDVVDEVVDTVAGDLLDSVDLDLGSALDLLNAGNPDGSDEGSEETNWTESTIIDGGGLFDDVISGIGGDTDILPDISGTVGEGLGVLDVEPDVNVGSLFGGLFG